QIVRSTYERTSSATTNDRTEAITLKSESAHGRRNSGIGQQDISSSPCSVQLVGTGATRRDSGSHIGVSDRFCRECSGSAGTQWERQDNAAEAGINHASA